MQLPAIELSRLAREGDVLVARNAQKGIVTFTDDVTKTTMVWEGSGDYAGADVIEVPASLLKNPKFREAVLRGILLIEDAPDVLQEALDKQRAEWDARQQKSQNAQVELQKTNDRVVARGVSCIAPKGGKGEICGSYGLVMGQNPSERPPLCGEHAHLAGQYVATETGRIGSDGKSEVVWQRASVVRS